MANTISEKPIAEEEFKIDFVSEEDEINLRYYSYLTMLVKSKMIKCSKLKKDENLKKTLSMLKRKYETVLSAHEKKLVKNLLFKMYLHNILLLTKPIQELASVLTSINETSCKSVFSNLNDNIKHNLNCLQLKNMKTIDFDEAFKTNIFGENSLLLHFIKHANKLSEVSQMDISSVCNILSAIIHLISETEDLRNRCTQTLDEDLGHIIHSLSAALYKEALSSCSWLSEMK